MSGELCGIIALNKPRDFTSFDAVAKLRGILKTKRIGHGGTLDPMAVGVLPIFVGKAAKCCDILPDKAKSYTAGFKLGFVSDTLDSTGNVLKKSDKKISRAELEEAAKRFIGETEQLPPMYSAVKIGGKKLYELAREGKSVERTPRRVNISRIEITEFSEETACGVMEIDCLQGTYVRSLIDDIGTALGVGGIMTSLIRTRSGGFTLADCVTFEQIERAEDKSTLLLKTDSVFKCYESVTLDERTTLLYKNGVKLRPQQAGFKAAREGTFRVYAYGGEFLGLGGFFGGEFKVVKNL